MRDAFEGIAGPPEVGDRESRIVASTVEHLPTRACAHCVIEPGCKAQKFALVEASTKILALRSIFFCLRQHYVLPTLIWEMMAMQLVLLPVSRLVINPHNDRHGELSSESAAIDWLLSRRILHMRNLANDIVMQAGIDELPLVCKEGTNYVVYDGNRRVTCLKLMGNPQSAPTPELQ